MRRAITLVLCLASLSPLSCFASTPLSNTPATEAQLAHLFKSTKPELYYCQPGIYDDTGNLDGDWGQPPSPGRITSAAWDIGNNLYLYAYQLSNPNWLEGTAFLGAWDVAVSGHSGYLSIPLRQMHVIPIDYDGDQALDTSFHLTDHSCSADFASDGYDCAPLTGALSVFTTGPDPCAYSLSDYYVTYPGGPGYPDGVSNDEIVEALEFNDGAQGRANFAVEYDPLCCAHGIFASTQIFGFVTDAPPDLRRRPLPWRHDFRHSDRRPCSQSTARAWHL